MSKPASSQGCESLRVPVVILPGLLIFLIFSWQTHDDRHQGCWCRGIPIRPCRRPGRPRKQDDAIRSAHGAAYKIFNHVGDEYGTVNDEL